MFDNKDVGVAFVDTKSRGRILKAFNIQAIGDREWRISHKTFVCAAQSQIRRESMEPASKSCLTSRDCAWRRAIEHSRRSDCFRLSKTECRDRSVNSLLSRIRRIGHDRVATLQPS